MRGIVCFRLRVERVWMETVKRTRSAQRCTSILSTLTLPVYM